LVPNVEALGVGNHEEPITSVRGAKGGSGDTIPLRIIPARGKVCEHCGKSSTAQGGNVFDEDRFWT
jgi:hypothetical protein